MCFKTCTKTAELLVLNRKTHFNNDATRNCLSTHCRSNIWSSDVSLYRWVIVTLLLLRNFKLHLCFCVHEIKKMGKIIKIDISLSLLCLIFAVCSPIMLSS